MPTFYRCHTKLSPREEVFRVAVSLFKDRRNRTHLSELPDYATDGTTSYKGLDSEVTRRLAALYQCTLYVKPDISEL